VNKAYQKKAEITIQGQDWSRLTSKELLKDVANNPGSGGISNMGAGIGLGIGTASVFSNLTNQLITPISSQQKEQHQPTQQNSRYKQKQSKEDVVECPKCKSMNPKTSKFCSECGAKLVVEKKKCPHCSAKVPETSKFCSECGEKL
jgi:membrane protease subunit (stomatin/prohibitin family)